MLANYHFHSLCSFDAEYPLTELCQAAADRGVQSLCLTDHCDVVNEQGQPDDSFDWSAVNAQLAAGRAAFPQLRIYKGVELGQAILRPEAGGAGPVGAGH